MHTGENALHNNLSMEQHYCTYALKVIFAKLNFSEMQLPGLLRKKHAVLFGNLPGVVHTLGIPCH